SISSLDFTSARPSRAHSGSLNSRSVPPPTTRAILPRPRACLATITHFLDGEGFSAVVRKIERDQNRFKQIVRGKIKGDLRKYITHGEMIGKTGGEFVSIPLPQIEIPEFRYGTKNRGGVGQGPGDVGTPIGRSSDGESGQG